MTELPPGFVLEQAPLQTQPPALPDGFVLEGAAPATAEKKPFGWQDTWPVRLATGIYDAAKSAVTLPGDVYAGRVAAGSDEAIRRSMDLAALSPMSAATRAGAGWAGAPKSAFQSSPSISALDDAAKAGYESVRKIDAEVATQPFIGFAEKIGQQLSDLGYSPRTAKQTFKALDDLKAMPSDAIVSPANIDTIRKSFGHVAQNFAKPVDQGAASRVISAFDEFVPTIPASSLAKGSIDDVAKGLSEARGNFSAARRAEVIDDALGNSAQKSASTNSGMNNGNTTRQTLRQIRQSDKAVSGFNEAELMQMDRVIEGTRTGNVLRGVGNFFGGGGGLGAAAWGIGGAAVNPILAAAPVIGVAARAGANASVNRQARLLAEMVRQRSPLGEEMASAVPQFLSPGMREAVARALLETGVSKLPRAENLPR